MATRSDVWRDIEHENCGYPITASTTIRLLRENNCHNTSIDVIQLKK